MKKIIIVLMFLLVSVSAFAQESGKNQRRGGWVAFTGGVSVELTGNIEGIDIPLSNTPYYNLGVVAGGNFSKYVGIETRLAFVPPLDLKTSTEIIVDVMLLVQQEINPNSSGFRPYIGVGPAFAFTFGDGFSSMGIGLGVEAGFRYFYKNFLIGIGANYNLFASEATSGWYSINYTHSNIRAGLDIGFTF